MLTTEKISRPGRGKFHQDICSRDEKIIICRAVRNRGVSSRVYAGRGIEKACPARL